MSDKLKPAVKRAFYEDPTNLETVLEASTIASKEGKILFFIDKLIQSIRVNGNTNIIDASYAALSELNLIELKK